ncbi:acyl-CoA dehydrogenase family protein [Actinophytocola sp.]|uniref:acyl-CoA dehydrogenase family protein n=1 Tax=Actinophytocola sp. TaxID=1872138 RepID=UPI002D7E1560|nr:acyl-CoA dehydrogenase family protein [Actinophytocola sp.]HET9140295.1 acyl-CoA dehydrogenase family protein [Actinophytocola sp.]
MALDEEILALPFYDPAHLDLAKRIEDWCASNTALWNANGDPEHTGRAIQRALGADGWFAFLDPAEESTMDLRSLCLAREALAYADDLADHAFAIQALAAHPIARFGTQPQQARYLPRIAAGELISSFALSEPEHGSDVAGLALTARRTAGGYVLDGSKAWIANGSTAGLHCVVARTGDGPGALGLTAFLVPADTPGVRVAERVAMIAPRPLAHLEFTGCRVGDDAVLGKPGGGFAVAMDLLDRFRMTVGAAAVGFARRAADAALSRARTRPLGDGRLFDLPTIRTTLADIRIKLNAAALLVARAAWEADTGNRRFAHHSSIAKAYATEAAQEIVDACVQIFGAAGLVSDSVPERLYRQIRSLRIYEGTTEIQKAVIATTLPR